MIPRPLQVLVVERDRALAATLASTLGRRGHDVRTVARAEAALVLAAPEVLVCEVEGVLGLELLRQLRAGGARPRTILIGRPDFEVCRRGMALGASDFLVKPLDLRELVLAVEGSLDEPWAATPAFELDCAALRPESERAARELCAYLVRHGVQPSTRARIVGASAELLDNACRHAYPVGAGRLRLAARFDGADCVVLVEDHGAGFDPEKGHAGLQDPVTSGIARARNLAEDLRLETAPGRGTRLELRFHLPGAAFAADGESDLSECDYLAPGTARRVLGDLGDPASEPRYVLSPALAVALGRMLAGNVREKGAQAALWT
jgi:DNA-binding response OmpR family regulator